MKKTIFTIAFMFIALVAIAGSRITRNYVQQPLSEVLIDIDKATTEINISFIYNKLEDYPVTCSLENATPIDAIRQVIGFYPVKVTQNGEDVIVEPIYDIEKKYFGRIVDESGQPLEFANVALYSLSDNRLLAGGVTNASGDFVIPCVQEAAILKASYIGYKPQSLDCHVGNVGTITLQEDAISLGEVRKNGTRPLAKMERGTLVYDMPFLLSIMPADDAYEALTRIPGVSELNGDLLFAGQVVTLIINGKATTLSAEQVKERLKQMPTERLAKAEVIMSAPARYHVRGAVINVVTKDNYGQKHFSGQLQSAGVYAKRVRGAGSGSLLFSQGKFSLDANYNYSGGGRFQKATHQAAHPLETGTKDYFDTNESNSHSILHNYRVGMEYGFSQNHRIDFTYNGKWLSSSNHNKASGTILSDQRSKTHNYINNADLNYSTPFGLKLGASYTHFEYPQKQRLCDMMKSDLSAYLSESGQNINKWNFTVDQAHLFAHDWGLNYGTQLQVTKHHSWQETHMASGDPVSEATGSIGYTERISSIYTSLSKDFGKKFSAEVGAQAENYHTPQWNEWRVYPTMSMMWRLNPSHILNLSLSSNSRYPNYWSLMNNIYYSSIYSEIWGNPDLKPMSSYELDLLWQFNQRYTFSLFYSYDDNFFVQLPYQPSDRFAVLMQETNFNFRQDAGLVASAQWKIGRFANGNVTAAILYIHDKSDNFHDIPFDRKHITGRLAGTAVINVLPKQNLLFIAQPVCQFNAIQGVFDIGKFFTLDLSLRWTNRNGRFSAALKGDNLTNFHFRTTDTWRGQNFSMDVWQNWRSIQLSLTYKFGNYKDKQHKEVDTSRMGH